MSEHLTRYLILTGNSLNVFDFGVVQWIRNSSLTAFIWCLDSMSSFSFDIMCCFSGISRNIQFFGLESQKKVSESYVVVIGLGGVGSHAASMLLRSGVGRLLLVDFDQVPSICYPFLYFIFSIVWHVLFVFVACSTY